MFKRKEKLKAKLLCLIFCTSLLPTSVAFAQTSGNTQIAVTNTSQLANVVQTTGPAVSFDDSNFDFDSETGTITAYKGSDSKVIIPSTINGVSVTSIGNYTFYKCNKVTSVTIPDSITNIEDYAFTFCNNLKSITIPDSVTSIGNYAFSFCNNLTTITIPNSVKSIGDGTFALCHNLTNVTIENGITSIGDFAFSGCTNLRSITIPNSATKVGNYAFDACTNLTSAVISNNVAYIGKGAFRDCRKAVFSTGSKEVAQLLLNAGVNGSQIILSGQELAVKASEVKLNAKAINLVVGASGKLTATVLPANATNKGVTWATSNNKVVTIDQSGSIQAVGAGIALMTVTTNDGSNKIASCIVKVTSSIKASEVKLNAKALNWIVGDSGKLTATVLPENTTNKGIIWSTSNSAVVTVDPNGDIKAVGSGIALITGKAIDGSNKIATCLIKVTKPIKASVIKLNANSLNLKVGKGGKLAAMIFPINTTNKNVVWTTSNSTVATIDENGNVKAVGTGTAIITCKTIDGSKKIITCKVTVKR